MNNRQYDGPNAMESYKQRKLGLHPKYLRFEDFSNDHHLPEPRHYEGQQIVVDH